MSEFDNCGLTASFTIKYRRGWSTKPQSRGTIFHKVAAECLREMARQSEESIPVDAALAILRDVLRMEWADRICPHCDSDKIAPGISTRGRRKCLECKKTFETELATIPLDQVKDLYWVVIKWAHDNSWDIGNLVSVEQRIEAEVRYPNRHTGEMVPRRISGKLDAVYLEDGDPTVVTVIDYKDMWSLPPQKEVSEGAYFQQRCYAMLLFANFPAIEKVILREQYVRFSQTRESSLSREQAEEVEGEMAALAERFDRAYEEKTWVPQSGKHCNFCIRPTACPIPVFARDEGRITDETRATQVAHQLIVAERVVKQARTALRAFADVHGPIPVRDAKGPRALGYVEAERLERPSLEQIEEAERMEGRQLTSAEVKRMYRRVPSTRFQAFTPQPELETDPDEEIIRQLEESLKEAS